MVKKMKNTTYSDSTQWLIEHYDNKAPLHPSPSQMAADVTRKYKQLEASRLAALQEGDSTAYYKARAQQDVLADLLEKWDVPIEEAGIDYTSLAPDMP